MAQDWVFNLLNPKAGIPYNCVTLVVSLRPKWVFHKQLLKYFLLLQCPKDHHHPNTSLLFNQLWSRWIAPTPSHHIFLQSNPLIYSEISNWSLPSRFSNQNFKFHISFMHATCPNLHILLDLITLIISCKHYKLWSSSLCNFFPTCCNFFLLRFKYSSQHFSLNKLSIPVWPERFMVMDELTDRMTTHPPDWPTHSLTHSWSRVLLEKLIVTWLVNKFSTFYETQRFIIVF